MTNATGLAKDGEVIGELAPANSLRSDKLEQAAGLRVRLRMDDDGDPIFTHYPVDRLGTVERIDGAVSWVKWDGTRNSVAYLSGKLEVVG